MKSRVIKFVITSVYMSDKSENLCRLLKKVDN